MALSIHSLLFMSILIQYNNNIIIQFKTIFHTRARVVYTLLTLLTLLMMCLISFIKNIIVNKERIM